jgi:hypothetical protein
MVKSNVVNLNTLLRESASDESVDNLKKVEKNCQVHLKLVWKVTA